MQGKFEGLDYLDLRYPNLIPRQAPTLCAGEPRNEGDFVDQSGNYEQCCYFAEQR